MISILARLEALGITEAHLANCKLPAYTEATHLVEAELDIFKRPQRMTPDTLSHWLDMRFNAGKTGITLELVSAYRSVDYQIEIIKNKLQQGRTIAEILLVNAIPGFSEHHTGCALDLTTTGAELLHVTFENTAAFLWLEQHASNYHFYLSYPKNNPGDIIYEPWHWAYRP